MPNTEKTKKVSSRTSLAQESRLAVVADAS